MGLEHEKPRNAPRERALEHEKPTTPPERALEPLARDDVRVAASALRCPFCHESVAPEASDWIACKLCLARHHTACWRESGRCATCGHDSSLAPTGEGAPANAPGGRTDAPELERARERAETRERIRADLAKDGALAAPPGAVGVGTRAPRGRGIVAKVVISALILLMFWIVVLQVHRLMGVIGGL